MTGVGFIMARVDLGECGRFEPNAVLDTIGVDPDYRNQGVGRALLSQLLVNLSTLRIVSGQYPNAGRNLLISIRVVDQCQGARSRSVF